MNDYEFNDRYDFYRNHPGAEPAWLDHPCSRVASSFLWNLNRWPFGWQADDLPLDHKLTSKY